MPASCWSVKLIEAGHIVQHSGWCCSVDGVESRCSVHAMHEATGDEVPLPAELQVSATAQLPHL